MVKIYNPNRKCHRVFKNKRASYSLLTEYFHGILEDNPGMTAIQIVAKVKKDLMLEINDIMANRVKRKVMKDL